MRYINLHFTLLLLTYFTYFYSAIIHQI